MDLSWTGGHTRAVPKSIRRGDRFDWQGNSPPAIPLERMVIYETHLKDHRPPLSKVAHRERTLDSSRRSVPSVPRRECRRAAPRARVLRRRHPPRKGSRITGIPNGAFSPGRLLRHRSPPGCQVEESDAGAELHPRDRVILDVVYNHTGEGNELGPPSPSRDRQSGRTTFSRRPVRPGPVLHELDRLRQLREPASVPAIVW